MSRLFYEDPDERPGFNLEDGGGAAAKSYLEKVAKLVPSEIVAGYITALGFITAADSVILWVVFAVCLFLTPAYLYYQSDEDKPKIIHLIVSTFAFMFWAYAISGAKLVPAIYQPSYGSIALILFTLVSGIIPLRK